VSDRELEQLFAGLAGEGTTQERGASFTLASEKAREKLQEFALSEPANFQLLAVAGLFALGSRSFEISVDADDFILSADHSLDREPFKDLWAYVSRGSEQSAVIGSRLLAMALLTSVRLGDVLWSIESNDEQGDWRFALTVRRGQLLEEAPRASTRQGLAGTRLQAKRKHLGQIAERYLNRWLGNEGPSPNRDLQLLRKRLFIPSACTLMLNGVCAGVTPAPAGAVLAVLETEGAPRLAACQNTHRLSRDYCASILLCDPGLDDRGVLPGEGNQMHWIWHGLSMRGTPLEGDLRHVRAFVWAPQLRPDLSFTSLVDNRDKQALERNIRNLARDLLDRFVRQLSLEIANSGQLDPGPFATRLAMVRELILERIDPRKDPSRFASLNRALIDCPLFPGSGEDGRPRWVSFREIWMELGSQRRVARLETYQEVPAWPGRPLVLFATAADTEMFRPRFPFFRLFPGATVLEQLDKLAPRPGMPTARPEASPALLHGSTTVAGHAVLWSLEKGAAERFQADPAMGGTLMVRLPGGAAFLDGTLGLPAGFSALVEADWRLAYEGGLADQGLREQLAVSLAASFCAAVSARPDPAEPLDAWLSSMALRWIAALPSSIGPWQEQAWLAIAQNGRMRRCSPGALQKDLARLQAPPYAAPWESKLPAKLPLDWQAVPLVLAAPGQFEVLAELLGQPVQEVRGFELLLQRRLPAWPQQLMVWSGCLEGAEAGAVSPDLLSLRLGIPRSRPGAHRRARVANLLRGYFLAESSQAWQLPYVRVQADWRDGWPDGKGEARLGVAPGGASSTMYRACLRLGLQFLGQAPAEAILAAEPEVVATLIFELLSDPQTASLPLLLLAGGSRVSLSQVPAQQGQARFFRSPTARPADDEGAAYLPGSLADLIGDLGSLDWVETGSRRAERSLDRSANSKATAWLSEPPAQTAGATAPAGGTPSPQPPAPQSPSPQPPAPRPAASPAQQRATSPVSSRAVLDEPPAAAAGPVIAPGPGSPGEAAAPPPPTAAPGAASGDPVGDAGAAMVSSGIPEVDALLGDLGEIFCDGAVPHGELFDQFLRRLRQDPESARALQLRDGEIHLGKPSARAVTTRHGRALLLSALYSVFNRQRPEVRDRDERLFHARLVEWARQSAQEPSGSARKSAW
jgi:hypothetical protein